MYSEYMMSNDKDLFWCYIKQIMNVFFIRAMEQIFSFGER